MDMCVGKKKNWYRDTNHNPSKHKFLNIIRVQLYSLI